MSVLQVRMDASGAWMEVPALRGADGKSAYEIAVENGYTGTEQAYGEILTSLENFATKEYVDGEVVKLQVTINELAASIENRYTKDEIDAMLTGAMNYKGSVDNLDALDVITHPDAGDIYTCKADGKNYIYNGTEWEEFGSAVDLSGYTTFSDVEEKVQAEAIARELADSKLNENIVAEAAVREQRDNELEAMITECTLAQKELEEAIAAGNSNAEELQKLVDELEKAIEELESTSSDRYEEIRITIETLTEKIENINISGKHNDLEDREVSGCHPMSAITDLVETLEGLKTSLEENIAEKVEILTEELEKKLDVGSTYSKEEIDSMLTGGLSLKGTIDSEDDLPQDPEEGDMYINKETNDALIWNGSRWENLGPLVSIDNLATKVELTETENKLQDEIDNLKESIGGDLSSQMTDINEAIEELKTGVSSKAESEDVYTKTETDTLLEGKQNVLIPGYGVTIDEETNEIEANPQIAIPDYSDPEIVSELPYTANSVCTIIGSVYSLGGGYTITMNGSTIITAQGWSNFTVNAKEGDVISADSTLDFINLSVLSLGYTQLASIPDTGIKTYWGKVEPEDSWGNVGDVYFKIDDLDDDNINLPTEEEV